MKMLKIILFLVPVFSLISCEENFNPFSEKKDVIILTSILRNDTAFQTLTLSASYQPDGYDPYLLTYDPTVRNADVRIWVNDSVFVFRDTTIKRTDTSKYKGDIYFYYHPNINLYPNSDIEVEVILQGGKKLSAKSKTAPRISFSTQSTTIISESSDNYVRVFWNTNSSDKYFWPRLIFNYYKLTNGVNVKLTKAVPIRYLTADGQTTPLFPQPSPSGQLLIPKSVLENSLREISQNDPDKLSYSVNEYVYVEVLSFDNSLSRYYSSSMIRDNLTITVDENDYSNISGGLGIFASYNKDTYRLRFYSTFITSLGYKFNYGY